MNRFQDLSNNRFTSRSRSFKREDTGNRFRTSNHGRFTNRTDQNRVNLPTNNRWQRDSNEVSRQQPRQHHRPSNFSKNTSRSYSHKRRSDIPPHELDSKFVDIKSMAVEFNQIKTKKKNH